MRKHTEGWAMVRKLCLFAMTFAVLLSLVVAGCGPVTTSGSGTPSAKPAEPIKIGYMGNLSWSITMEAFNALELAVNEINKDGGILGRPLELVKEDTKGQAPLAAAAYKKLVMTDQVDVVVAPEQTDIQLAIQEAGAELYPEYKHICMNALSTAEDMGLKVQQQHERYKFYFRPCSKTTSYFPYLRQNAEFLAHYTKAKTAALLIEDAVWTQGFRKGLDGQFPPFKDTMEEIGMEVVYYAETAVGEKMFLPIFENVAAKKPDLIFFLDALSDATIFVKQWAQSAAKDIDLYNNGGQSTMAGFYEMTGGAALGLLTPTYSGAALSERTLPFVRALKETYGDDPNWVSYSTYDIPYLLKEGAEKAGTTEDMDAWIAALEKVDIVGVSGRAAFDETHTYKWGSPYMECARGQYQKDGEMVVLYPYDVAESSNPGKTFIPVKELRAMAGQ